MKRVNPHGEAMLDVRDYSYEGYFDNDTTWMFWAATNSGAWVGRSNVDAYRELAAGVLAWRERLTKESTSVYPKVGYCAHCGMGIRYHVVYRHKPTGALLAIGETCAANRLDLNPAEWRTYKARLDKLRKTSLEGKRKVEKREETRKVFPEAAALLEECLAERALLLESGPAIFEGARKTFDSRWPYFVVDVAFKLEQKGEISERQAAAVVKAVGEFRERAAQRAAEREAAAANAKPLPTGKRIAVEGTILAVKWQDSDFGGGYKMLVEGDGWKVWGTLPDAIYRLGVTACENGAAQVSGGIVTNLGIFKGWRVRFFATVEAKAGEPSFGYFKRPTKAEKVGE